MISLVLCFGFPDPDHVAALKLHPHLAVKGEKYIFIYAFQFHR